MQPILISVGGGKGGVGKSVIAANLALAIADLGFRTVLVDADLGAANQHTLFGIDRPGRTLQALIDRDVRSLEEVASPTGAPRLFLVPGVGAIPGAANLGHGQKLKLIRHMKKLDAEVVVIDVGAGVSYNVLDFFDAADLRLVVSTPQMTAMQNAYCFMRAAVHRGLKRRIGDAARVRTETGRISDLRRRLVLADPDHAVAFSQVTDGFETRIIGNMLEGPGQQKVLAALTRMVHDFLDVTVPVAATLSMSRCIHESVTRRRPFMLSAPSGEASRALTKLAEDLVSVDVTAIRELRRAELPAEDEPPTADGARSLIDYLRTDERVEVDHAVRVELGGNSQSVLYARMLDLSPTGTMLEGDLAVDIGDELTLTLTGLEGCPRLAGVVRHVAVSGDRVGVELDASARSVTGKLLAPLTPRRSSIPPDQLAS